MLRADGDPEIRVFDPAIRLLHWLTVLLAAAREAAAADAGPRRRGRE